MGAGHPTHPYIRGITPVIPRDLIQKKLKILIPLKNRNAAPSRSAAFPAI